MCEPKYRIASERKNTPSVSGTATRVVSRAPLYRAQAPNGHRKYPRMSNGMSR